MRYPGAITVSGDDFKRRFDQPVRVKVTPSGTVPATGARAAGVERTLASQFDAATYDIVLYYAWAMKEGKVSGDPKRLAEERTAIRDALKRMKEFPALEGSISFGADNDALKPVYVQELRSGKWMLLETHPAPQ